MGTMAMWYCSRVTPSLDCLNTCVRSVSRTGQCPACLPRGARRLGAARPTPLGAPGECPVPVANECAWLSEHGCVDFMQVRSKPFVPTLRLAESRHAVVGIILATRLLASVRPVQQFRFSLESSRFGLGHFEPKTLRWLARPPAVVCGILQ